MRCLQWTAAAVIGSVEPFSMTEFVINRLKVAETQDWVASHPALRRAIIMSKLPLPGLADVVANINGVWPLVVSYGKNTGQKDDRDSLVVRSSGLDNLSCGFHSVFSVDFLFRRKGWTETCTWIN